MFISVQVRNLFKISSKTVKVSMKNDRVTIYKVRQKFPFHSISLKKYRTFYIQTKK